MITKNSCTGCGECRRACDHEECKPFDRCIKRCVKGNIKVCGVKMTAEELAKRLQKQKVFF